MTYALELHHVRKNFEHFTLQDISLELPRGYILGLIGENGAGKSTIIKLLLNLLHSDGGQIEVLGIPAETFSAQRNEQIGVVMDERGLPEMLNLRQVNRIMEDLYSSWDSDTFYSLTARFGLPEKSKIKTYSRGMKMKLSIACALAHDSRLLILDEATSGLDPVIRDDILDMLLDFVQEEDHSILVSSHITSDLEKIADYIVFIHAGKVVFSKPKDELVEQYGIIKCGAAQFEALDKLDIIVYRKMDYEWQVLVADRVAMKKKYPKALIVSASIDEIMLLYVKGERGK